MQPDKDRASHAYGPAAAGALALGIASCVWAEILSRAKLAAQSGRRQGDARCDDHTDRSVSCCGEPLAYAEAIQIPTPKMAGTILV